MVRLLQKHGNSVALVLDKTMLESMNMSADTPVQVTLHGNSMTVTPVNIGVPDDELDAAIARLRPRYKTMLENLAK
jgi:antitoxin component of MazEF toxin-antitoxin module